MYYALLIGLLVISVILFVRGINKQKKGSTAIGIILGLLTVGFFWFMGFWADALWFEAVGYSNRFWTVIGAQAGMFGGGLLIGGLLTYFLCFSFPKERRQLRVITSLLGALIGAVWGVNNWEVFLKFINKVNTGITDPILGQDTGFYLFSLPFLDSWLSLLSLIAIVSFGATIIAIYMWADDEQLRFHPPEEMENDQSKLFRSFFLSASILIVVIAYGIYLNRFDLMYSSWGAVHGPGWTDVNLRLPAYLIVAIIFAAAGIAFLIPSLRNILKRIFVKRSVRKGFMPLYLFGTVAAGLFGIWLVALVVVPSAFQWLRVEPNEITFEKPYIANNIEFTRYGFKLNDVEEKEYPAEGNFTRDIVEQNRTIFNNIRLWDWRALDAVFKQFQEIRLYYEFTDVDIDRYFIDDTMRQMMISAREMEVTNLPEQSQTFVNKRFKYTHGYGLTLTKVNEFTPQGLPNLLVEDIPPISKHPSLDVDTPQIYYGELTNNYVVGNSKEPEFDYPKGDENEYIQYPGKGGVLISNFWRKFIFGWKFDGTRFLFSSYPKSDSRMMFKRQIKERVREIAPFLHLDDDPYVVLENGKMYWMIDAYTTSNYYPYSEPFNSLERIEYSEGERGRSLSTLVGNNLNGINYIRNSVKVVVDAFNGTVDFYIFDDNDPLIKVWSKIFPQMFKPRSEMPDELERHIRYPVDMLLVQGLVYAKYHMSDPTVFYNQEDLWVRSTEKYYNQVQPVDPYYIMWELPESNKPEFVLILPFTPKKRQVLIGWIAGMCDPDNYGRFLAYKFPKDQWILGPQQVETKIDQDRHLSGQLSLWDQRGSNVIRGNVLAIPIEKTVIYVEPIYLQAETAAYPELRLVVVMHKDEISYAENFQDALSGLFGESVELDENESIQTITATGGSQMDELIKDATEAYQDYIKYTGEQNFEAASKALQRLKESLNKLNNETGMEESKSDTTQIP